MCLIYEQILAERVGYETKSTLAVTKSPVYIWGDYCLYILGSTYPCSRFSSSESKVIFRGNKSLKVNLV